MKGERNIYAFMRGFGCLLAAACAGFLISCTKDNPGTDPWQVMSETPVEFTVHSSAAAPGTKVTDAGFENGDNLGIFAYLVSDNSVSGIADENSVFYTTPYISNWVLNYSTNNQNQVYDSPYYWPKFDHCDYESLWFYSYYANYRNGVGPQLVSEDGQKPHFNYVTDIAGEASIEDFLVAQSNATQNNVPLNFKHPLAKIEWYVKNLDFIGAKGVDISFPIVSTGVYEYKSVLSGNLIEDAGNNWTSFGTETPMLELDNEVFVPGITQEDYNNIFSGANPNYDGVTAVKVDECYLIPQKLNGLAVVFNYHTEPEQNYTNTGMELKGFSETLLPGHIHKITLIINRHQVIRVGILTIDESNKSIVNEKWYSITNTNEI